MPHAMAERPFISLVPLALSFWKLQENAPAFSKCPIG